MTCDGLTSQEATDGQLRQVRLSSHNAILATVTRAQGSTWVTIIVLRHRRSQGKAEERHRDSDNDMTHLDQDTARRPLLTINIINPFPTPGLPSL